MHKDKICFKECKLQSSGKAALSKVSEIFNKNNSEYINKELVNLCLIYKSLIMINITQLYIKANEEFKIVLGTFVLLHLSSGSVYTPRNFLIHSCNFQKICFCCLTLYQGPWKADQEFK